MKHLRGVGIDLVEVARIAKLKDNHRFLQKCFTPAEIEYCFQQRFPEQSLAARFAAKEAAGKAIGVGIMNKFLLWKDVEVVSSDGKPRLRINGRAGEILKDAEFHLSLTHTSHQAAAVVYFECENFEENKFKDSVLNGES